MTERTVKLGEYNRLFFIKLKSSTAIFFLRKIKRDDLKKTMLSLTTTTALKTPQFIGIKFAKEEKTSLVEDKNIKSGEINEGGEVVVKFNGKDEKAKVIVLSGKCTLSLLLISFYT